MPVIYRLYATACTFSVITYMIVNLSCVPLYVGSFERDSAGLYQLMIFVN